VSWIGGQFAVDCRDKSVTVKIKQDVFDEARASVARMVGSNVVPMKELRSGIGKLSNIANLLTIWRPFLSPMYAALFDPKPVGAPTNCIWSKQIAQPLRWFQAFFKGSGGMIERRFELQYFLQSADDLEIVIDASPWGLAAVLVENQQPTEYFSDAIGEVDIKRFGYAIGSPDGQQVWESLAALVALKLWKPTWASRAAKLRLKGDSMTMLSLVVNMRPSSPQLSLIGQELSLVFSNVAFVPIMAQHIPGVANVAADALSRWHQPGKPRALPPQLRHARARVPPPRGDDYFYLLNGNSVPDTGD